MKSKSFMILGLAVACGLVAMYGVGQFLTKKDKPVEMRDVLLAARNLKVEELLKPDVVKVAKMPANAVPVGAFSSLAEVEGRWIQIPTLDGEPIVAAKLAPKDSPPGLIGRIPKGMRAFAVEVNEQTGVSGFIMPDHHVDVLQDLQVHGNRGRSSRAKTILQNVLVLAVGQVFTRPEDKSMVVRTVTLAIEPSQAETLTAARARGPLTLALRGLNDAELVAMKEPEPDPEEQEPAPVRAPTAPPIVIAEVQPKPEIALQSPRHRLVTIIHGVRSVNVLRVPHPHAATRSPVGLAHRPDALQSAPAQQEVSAHSGPTSGTPSTPAG